METESLTADAWSEMASAAMAAPEHALDLCFILDATGSMGAYLAAATQSVRDIAHTIQSASGLASLHLGLVAYRDHPPQDRTYVTRTTALTPDIDAFHAALARLTASGGGDGPEATTAAMAATLSPDMGWRPHATKITILVTDAPCHGIGEYGDGFRDGDPDGHDPLRLAKDFATAGITLFMIACEPTLSQFLYATEFYRALCYLTGGSMIPLFTADLLAKVIIGFAVEQMDMENLIAEVGHAVVERLGSGQESVDEIAKALHDSLLLQNTTTRRLTVESIYKESDEATHNFRVWTQSLVIGDARPQLKRINGSRFTDKYLRHRTSQMSSRRSVVPVHINSSQSKAPAEASTSSSPSRAILTSFSTFTSTASMQATPTIHDPSLSQMRDSRGFDMDEDDDEDSGRLTSHHEESTTETYDSNLSFSVQPISIDQARRIAISSASRIR